MKKIFFCFVPVFAFSDVFAQDTLKVKMPDDGRFCTLVICEKQKCFTDSVPMELFGADHKIELRVNDRCSAKKKTDVFVRSFEIGSDGSSTLLSAPSSFFTESQMKLIRVLKPGDALHIKNVVIHGPDAFRKIEDIKIILK